MPKKAAVLFFATFLSLFFLFLILMYIYDPLSVFHMPFARNFTFGNNMRKQNLALIKHLSFDSIIIGNSHTENTSSKEAGEMLKGRFINTSMSGSALYEQSFVLDYVLRHNKIKIVFGILSEGISRSGHGSYPLSEWTFLYDDNWLNDFQVYVNGHYLQCLARWSELPECVGRADPDRPVAWFAEPFHASRFGGLDNWILYSDNSQLTDVLHKKLPENAEKTLAYPDNGLDPQTAVEIKSIIAEFIVLVAKKYPDTNFVYFFNPESLLHRAIQARDGSLSFHIFWIREALSMCADLSNVQLYLFDNEPFTEYIENYKDLTHYSSEVSSLILQSVRAGKNRLTPDNVDEQIGLLKERAAAYDLRAVNDYVRKELRRREAGEGSAK